MTPAKLPPQKLVTVAILTCKQKVALQKRDGGTEIYPNFWGLFGGSLEGGETPLQSVLREIREELGIRLGAVRSVGTCLERPSRLNSGHEFVAHVFLSDITRGWPRRRLSEGESCGLFDWPQIRRMKREVTPMAFRILACHFGAGSSRLYARRG